MMFVTAALTTSLASLVLEPQHEHEVKIERHITLDQDGDSPAESAELLSKLGGTFEIDVQVHSEKGDVDIDELDIRELLQHVGDAKGEMRAVVIGPDGKKREFSRMFNVDDLTANIDIEAIMDDEYVEKILGEDWTDVAAHLLGKGESHVDGIFEFIAGDNRGEMHLELLDDSGDYRMRRVVVGDMGGGDGQWVMRGDDGDMWVMAFDGRHPHGEYRDHDRDGHRHHAHGEHSGHDRDPHEHHGGHGEHEGHREWIDPHNDRAMREYMEWMRHHEEDDAHRQWDEFEGHHGHGDPRHAVREVEELRNVINKLEHHIAKLEHALEDERAEREHGGEDRGAEAFVHAAESFVTQLQYAEAVGAQLSKDVGVALLGIWFASEHMPPDRCLNLMVSIMNDQQIARSVRRAAAFVAMRKAGEMGNAQSAEQILGAIIRGAGQTAPGERTRTDRVTDEAPDRARDRARGQTKDRAKDSGKKAPSDKATDRAPSKRQKKDVS